MMMARLRHLVLKKEFIMQIEHVRVQSCSIISTTDGEMYIRHAPDHWELVFGMSTEIVTDSTELEAVYQEYLGTL